MALPALLAGAIDATIVIRAVGNARGSTLEWDGNAG